MLRTARVALNVIVQNIIVIFKGKSFKKQLCGGKRQILYRAYYNILLNAQ